MKLAFPPTLAPHWISVRFYAVQHNLMNIIGFDAATVPKKQGFALGRLQGDQCVIERLVSGDQFKRIGDFDEWIKEPALIAIDAPLGWPMPLAQCLPGHQAGEPVESSSKELFNRLTDREIHERIKKKPLDVGADRIARTAHAALQWLDDIAKTRGAPIPLAWEPFSKGVQAIEVYPAATLCLRGYPDSGYKGNGAKEKASLGVRREILSKLKNDLEFDCDLSSAEQCADILDAVLCVLAGKDFLCGQSKAPSSDMASCAKKEGWIWAKR